MNDYDGGTPYVPVAARRLEAMRELAALEKKGHRASAGRHRRSHHRQDVLGQGLVRQPRALQRLREPVAARPDLRPQRIGGRSADRARRGDGAGERLRPLSDRGQGRRRPEGPMDRRLPGLRGRHRLARRTAAGALLAGCDDAHLSREDGPVSVAGGNQVHVQLSRLGVDVQTRGGRALRHRRPAGRKARSPVRAAQGRPSGSHRAGGQGPGAAPAKDRRPGRSSTPAICRSCSGSTSRRRRSDESRRVARSDGVTSVRSVRLPFGRPQGRQADRHGPAKAGHYWY